MKDDERNAEMKNINSTDVAVSSRVRFARNIADYPFAAKCDKTSANEIIEKVRGALNGDYTETDFEENDALTSGALVENHSISREFAHSKLPHALFTSRDRRIKIMVCEEDHIRLQSIVRGFSLDEAYRDACKADDVISEHLNIAFDEKLGYLTHCPTNLGTGMRASVMLFLPALTATRKIKPLVNEISKMGLTIRGIYGEGSEALGCLYQISNSETLGVSEESVISKLNDIIKQIIDIERKSRAELMQSDPDGVIDRVMRSLGTLKYAHKLDSAEFMRCYADVRMGVALDIIKDIDYETLDSAFTEVMPYTLMKHSGKKLGDAERDVSRAKRIKELI